jgi:hypothetical protein
VKVTTAPEVHRLAAGAALADEVGGHDGLAVAGCHGVQHPEDDGRGDGQQRERDGEVLAAEEVGEGAGEPVHPTGRHLVGGHAAGDRGGAGGVPVHRELRRRDVDGGLEQVLGIAGEQLGRAVLRCVRTEQRSAEGRGADLAPAVALGGHRVAEPDVLPRPLLRHVRALDAGDRQPGGSLRAPAG